MIQISLAIISNEKNQILLQHRDNNAPTNPNKWGLWGGRIDKDEAPIEAIIRELKEELDIKISINDLKLFKDYPPDYFSNNRKVHVFHVKDTGNLIYNQREGDALKFISVKEINNSDIEPLALQIIQDYFLIQVPMQTLHP